MSTRCQVLFAVNKTDKTPVRVYVHSDGYPSGEHGIPALLAKFFKAVQEQTFDTRFGDPEYLAAKFIVWLALRYGGDPKSPLNFLGVCPAHSLHGDEQYEYRVICNDDYFVKSVPVVEWRRVGGKWKVAKCDGTDGE